MQVQLITSKAGLKKMMMMKRRDPGWRRGGSVVVRVLPKIPEGDFDPVYRSLQNTYTGKNVADTSSLNERTPGCNAIRRKSYVSAPLVAASAAAEYLGELLHKAFLLRFLLPLLLSVRALCRCRAVLVRVEIRLAVLELSLIRGCIGRCQFPHALAFDLRTTCSLVSWASSGLGSCRSWLWERLV